DPPTTGQLVDPVASSNQWPPTTHTTGCTTPNTDQTGGNDTQGNSLTLLCGWKNQVKDSAGNLFTQTAGPNSYNVWVVSALSGGATQASSVNFSMYPETSAAQTISSIKFL